MRKFTEQAAAKLALGYPHKSASKCVSPGLIALWQKLNSAHWSSEEIRMRQLCRLAIAQLGTGGFSPLFNWRLNKELANLTIRKLLPQILRICATQQNTRDRLRLATLGDTCLREGARYPRRTAVLAAEVTENIASYSRGNLACAEALSIWNRQDPGALEIARRASRISTLTSMAASAAVTTTFYFSVGTPGEAAVYVADAGATCLHIRDGHRANPAVIDPPTDPTEADQLLIDFTEQVIQILQKLDTAGSHFLYLVET